MLRIIAFLILTCVLPGNTDAREEDIDPNTSIAELSSVFFTRMDRAALNERPKDLQREDYEQFLRRRYRRVNLNGLRYWEANFFSSQEIYRLGLLELAQLKQSARVLGRLPSRALLERVARSTISHPVIGVENLAYYDPTGAIRFCFGVSTYVHELLVRLGFSPQAIVKAFVVGSGTWGDGREAFHQSTVVLADDGRWYAVDQFFAHVKPVEDWFHFFWSKSGDQKLRLYITDADRFTPAMPHYDFVHMGVERNVNRSAAYRGYFRNLYNWLNRPHTERSFDE